MRVRDHVALSTAAAAGLAPWLGHRAVGLWAGSVLIDADHYAWFCVSERRLSPAAAVRYFGRAHPRRQAATRALHSPAALATAFVLGLRRAPLLPIALGMGLHVALDAHHEARMTRARAAALARDRYRCRACGRRGRLAAHLWRQPPLLPSYRTENLVTLCGRCHEAAHAAGSPTWS